MEQQKKRPFQNPVFISRIQAVLEESLSEPFLGKRKTAPQIAAELKVQTNNVNDFLDLHPIGQQFVTLSAIAVVGYGRLPRWATNGNGQKKDFVPVAVDYKRPAKELVVIATKTNIATVDEPFDKLSERVSRLPSLKDRKEAGQELNSIANQFEQHRKLADVYERLADSEYKRAEEASKRADAEQRRAEFAEEIARSDKKLPPISPNALTRKPSASH